MFENLREQVLYANQMLGTSGLVKLTFGNVSGVDRDTGSIVIKPSGVPYEKLTVESLVVLDGDGNKIEGDLNPSTDAPTHVLLYKAFKKIGGITHTHSIHASAFAQACRELPCLGTTHADHFMGTVPLARALKPEEMDDYEVNTGNVIVERFKDIAPLEMPAVLVAHHGPFTWGKSPLDSVKNGIALDACAEMALGTLKLNPDTSGLPRHILDKHYQRKHGSDAYYGQG